MSSGQQVLIKLRKMIIAGELEGGARVAEIPTAELLGVSRQPVRMAFRLLEQEGLLIKNPTRGYTVREISEKLVNDALEVRGILEGLAAKTIAEQGLTEEQKKTLQNCIVETEKLFDGKTEFGDHELERYHHFNVIFHDTIIQGAQNVALIQALAKNNQLPMASAQAITYDQTQALSEYRRLHYAHLQHCSIYDALIHRQAGRAETLMREHSSVVVLGETLRNVLSQ
ncbi:MULTISPECIES: GntR family transcriptional regulator [Acinetobacter]|jgi:GntR family transcriptional regulator of vanillate catabolism|uniref:GntR family transcriptional regulator n=1 Tax=Acinetobacter TaxID=469 RepID=UPI0006FD20A3|nr:MULTISPECIES: GntR family transcriptional regulator [Acinetobacter]KQX00102.1 GntR family transcriptional regulator [Acinetobacter sp. Root1280]MCS4300283.1 GntR family transcriptional regulator of vanillate catabolism [Acinetobacter guillouiae]MCU4494783.1 GntR family transcriptional regulator [Acinetobacter guillouiae]MCW2253578.1 GntR family transcriptional regulator of vanillate catabolism [Acinetobacter sp. BIGb0204]NII35781.1 GntR family transcriptional regulator of vanillate cataboli